MSWATVIAQRFPFSYLEENQNTSEPQNNFSSVFQKCFRIWTCFKNVSKCFECVANASTSSHLWIPHFWRSYRICEGGKMDVRLRKCGMGLGWGHVAFTKGLTSHLICLGCYCDIPGVWQGSLLRSLCRICEPQVANATSTTRLKDWISGLSFILSNFEP